MYDYVDTEIEEFESDGDFATSDEGGLPSSTQEYIDEQEKLYQEEREVKALAWNDRMKRRLKRLQAKLAMVEKARRISAPKDWLHKKKPKTFEEKVTKPKDSSPSMGR